MTAVEWLLEGILNYQIKKGVIPQNIIEQAKEMEKQQIIEAYEYSIGVTSFKTNTTAKQYYNETFKKQ